MKKFQWREKSKKLTNIFITSAFLATQLLLPAAATTKVFAVQPSDPGPPGNNGSLKVHEIGTPVGTENEDPKVCAFNFEGFGFDVGQTGYIKIDGQGQTSSNYGNYDFGPTTAAAEHVSYAVSQDFNHGAGTVSIADGHYKATLYGKDTGGTINLQDEKAKSKVFKVDCEPDVSAVASLFACTPGSNVNDQIRVTVTDNAQTDQSDTYHITLNGVTTNLSFPNGAGEAFVEFHNLTAGVAYAAQVTGPGIDGILTTNSVTVGSCTTPTPPTPAKPTFSVDKLECVASSGNTDQVKVTVTNTTDDTHASATYTVTVGAATQTTAAIADGQSQTLTFSGLAAGAYTVGVSGDDGTSATSAQVTVAVCPKPVIKPCTQSTGTTDVTPSNLQGFDFSETRATGHYVFTSSGLHTYTEGNTSTDKVAAYKNVDVALSDVGTTDFSYTKIGGDPNVAPGYQLYVDNGKTGAAHVAGYVVHEPDYYGNNWWSNKDFGVGAGGGYTSYAPLSDYLASNPDAHVYQFGFSLGSGVKGDGTLQDIQFNCHTWHFTKPDTGSIRVKKELWPASDSGKFNLNVDGVVKAANVGNGGDTGYVEVPVGAHAVSETAGTATALSNYESFYKCSEDTQAQLPVSFLGFNTTSLTNHNVQPWHIEGRGTSLGNLQITKDKKITCVFTNKRIPKVTIVKDARPNSSQAFTFDTTAQYGSFNLTDDGTDTKNAKSFSSLDGDGWHPYLFNERKADGWKLSDISCDSGKWKVVLGVLVVTPKYGEDITCTFVNTKKPTVVTPAPVIFTQPTCENPNGSYTIPATEGVVYKVGGDVKAAGTYSAPAGTTVTVTAEADSGSVLAGGATQSWRATFTAKATTDCVQGDTDVCPNLAGSQATVPSGYVKDTQTGNCITPVVTTGGMGGGEVLGASTVAPAVLANTGESIWLNVVAGLVTILAAIGLTVATRKQAVS